MRRFPIFVFRSVQSALCHTCGGVEVFEDTVIGEGAVRRPYSPGIEDL
jgi:hypothetical protein